MQQCLSIWILLFQYICLTETLTPTDWFFLNSNPNPNPFFFKPRETSKACNNACLSGYYSSLSLLLRLTLSLSLSFSHSVSLSLSLSLSLSTLGRPVRHATMPVRLDIIQIHMETSLRLAVLFVHQLLRDGSVTPSYLPG
jgi:hypothetical protein